MSGQKRMALAGARDGDEGAKSVICAVWLKNVHALTIGWMVATPNLVLGGRARHRFRRKRWQVKTGPAVLGMKSNAGSAHQRIVMGMRVKSIVALVVRVCAGEHVLQDRVEGERGSPRHRVLRLG